MLSEPKTLTEIIEALSEARKREIMTLYLKKKEQVEEAKKNQMTIFP